MSSLPPLCPCGHQGRSPYDQHLKDPDWNFTEEQLIEHRGIKNPYYPDLEFFAKSSRAPKHLMSELVQLFKDAVCHSKDPDFQLECWNNACVKVVKDFNLKIRDMVARPGMSMSDVDWLHTNKLCLVKDIEGIYVFFGPETTPLRETRPSNQTTNTHAPARSTIGLMLLAASVVAACVPGAYAGVQYCAMKYPASYSVCSAVDNPHYCNDVTTGAQVKFDLMQDDYKYTYMTNTGVSTHDGSTCEYFKYNEYNISGAVDSQHGPFISISNGHGVRVVNLRYYDGYAYIPHTITASTPHGWPRKDAIGIFDGGFMLIDEQDSVTWINGHLKKTTQHLAFYNGHSPNQPGMYDFFCEKQSKAPFQNVIYYKCDFPIAHRKEFHGIEFFHQEEPTSHYIALNVNSFLAGSVYYRPTYWNGTGMDSVDIAFDFTDVNAPIYDPMEYPGIASLTIPGKGTPYYCHGDVTYGGYKFFNTISSCNDSDKDYGINHIHRTTSQEAADAINDCIANPISLTTNGRYLVCFPKHAYQLHSLKKIKFTDCRKISTYRYNCALNSDFVGYRVICNGLNCPPPIGYSVIGQRALSLYLNSEQSMPAHLYQIYKSATYKTSGGTKFLTSQGPWISLLVVLVFAWILMLIFFAFALVYSIIELVSIRYPAGYDYKLVYFMATFFMHAFMSLAYMSYLNYKTLLRMTSAEVHIRSLIAKRNFMNRWILLSFLGFFMFPVYCIVQIVFGIFMAMSFFRKKAFKPDKVVLLETIQKQKNEWMSEYSKAQDEKANKRAAASKKI